MHTFLPRTLALTFLSLFSLNAVCMESKVTRKKPKAASEYIVRKADGGTVPYCYVVNCDKDGACVASRVTSAISGCSETRTLAINPDANLIGADYFQTRCAQTCRYYNDVASKNPLLKNDCIVMGSVHELGLYFAEALHARYLPLAFLGFADTWQRIRDTLGVRFAMSDYGVANRFWVWCKFGKASDVPQVYLDQLRLAKNVFIIRSTETEDASAFVGQYDGIYIHSSTLTTGNDFTRNIVQQIPAEPISEYTRNGLKQHEWGLPDRTIDAMRQVWASLGKDPANFHVVEGGTVQLFSAIPRVWEKYLNVNRRPIKGITLNAYWVAHPSMERRDGLIPFHFYRFKDAVQEWEPYDALIKEIVARNWQNLSPFIVRSFINNIGSGGGVHSDVEEVHNFLAANNLGPDNPNINSYFLVGMDCTGAQCTGYDGSVLDDIPSTKVRKWLTETAFQNSDRAMIPITVAVICMIASSLGILR